MGQVYFHPGSERRARHVAADKRLNPVVNTY